MAFVYEKQIPFGDHADDMIKQEKEVARQAGLEFSCSKMSSYYLVKVETDDQATAAGHKLLSTGYIISGRDGDDANSS